MGSKLEAARPFDLESDAYVLAAQSRVYQLDQAPSFSYMQLLSLCLSISLAAAADVYLPPLPGKSGSSKCVVILQGAQIGSTKYAALGTSIQKTFSGQTHVVIPQFLLDLPIPADLPLVTSVHDKIKNAAEKYFPVNCQKVPLILIQILIGHSLGAAAAMREASAYPKEYAATILLGASVQRPFYTSGFPTPILTLNGQLDGLHRISRVAEAFFNLFDRKKVSLVDGVGSNPVIIVKGATHMQFADGVDPPKVVKNLDLVPQVSVDAYP